MAKKQLKRASGIYGNPIESCVIRNNQFRELESLKLGKNSIFSGFLPGIFFGGGESIVRQISFVMPIFLLFSDQISGGGKSLWGGGNCLRGAPPLWKKASFG